MNRYTNHVGYITYKLQQQPSGEPKVKLQRSAMFRLSSPLAVVGRISTFISIFNQSVFYNIIFAKAPADGPGPLEPELQKTVAYYGSNKKVSVV